MKDGSGDNTAVARKGNQLVAIWIHEDQGTAAQVKPTAIKLLVRKFTLQNNAAGLRDEAVKPVEVLPPATTIVSYRWDAQFARTRARPASAA